MNPVDQRVRLLVPSDAGGYVVLRRAMLADSPLAYSASPGSDQGSDEALVRERLGRPDQAIAGGFVTASSTDEQNERLVAAAGLVRDARPKLAHRALVWGVWVEPGARGAGLGEAVVRRVVEIARRWEGVSHMTLSVGETQAAAKRVYERIGFVTWGFEPDAHRYEGKLYGEFHMQLEL